MSIPSSKKFNWNLLFLIFLYVTTFMWAGLSEWVQAGFDTTILFTPTWWAQVFESVMLNHAILIGTIIYVLNEANEKHILIIKERQYLQDVVDQQVHPDTFNPYMLNFNRRRKIKKYIRNMKAKEDKLDRKAKYTDIEQWEKYKETQDRTLLQSSYCHRKSNTQEQTTPEYIEKHIGNLRVKGFKEIQTTFVTCGYTARYTDNEDNLVPEGAFNKMAGDLFPRVIITIAVLTALRTIILEAVVAQDPRTAVVGTLMHIIPMVVQIFIAVSYSRRYIDEKILVDFRKRKEIIATYLAEKGGTA